MQALSEEKNPSPAQISERTLIDSATLSGVLDRMAEAGLIRKEENPEDRRSIRVSLTLKKKVILLLAEGLAGQTKGRKERSLR